MSPKQSAYLKALFSVTVWGASFIATKYALREVSPVTVVWLRFLIGVIVLGLLVVMRRQFAFPKANEIPLFLLLGFLGITFHQWLQSNGLLTSDASTTGWIIATGPVFMALLGWLFLQEKLGWRRVGGIALAGLGVITVISKGNLGAVLAGSFGAPGDWLILASSPNWAVFSTVSRSALERHPAARMMFFVMLFGWLLTSIQFFGGGFQAEIALLTRPGWLGIGFLGLFCTGLAYFFWYDALKVLPASQLGVFLYFEPLSSVAVAAALLNEPVTAASMLGGAVILFGVWQVNRRTVRKKVQDG